MPAGTRCKWSNTCRTILGNGSSSSGRRSCDTRVPRRCDGSTSSSVWLQTGSPRTSSVNSPGRGTDGCPGGRGVASDRGRLVSVVITVYNCARYLAEAIDSVRHQTYRPLELIVVDDGSDDGSGEIARRHQPFVRYVYTPRGGIGAARR